MLKEIFDFIKNNKWYVLLVLGLLGLYFYQFHGGLSSDSEKWDHFGSYIGGIFSAVTLLSVLHGMQLERKRFNEQKAEFENEKREQEERRRKEDFERTFFMMLEQHNQKIKELNEKGIIDELYNKIMNEDSYTNIDDIKSNFNFGENLKEYSELNVYFLVLYRFLKYIYENDRFNSGKSNSKNKYSSVLRSFLSRKLLILLVFHLSINLDDEQYDEYRKYITYFSFLEHMDTLAIESDFLYRNIIRGHIKKEELYKELVKIVNNKNVNIDKLSSSAKEVLGYRLNKFYPLKLQFDVDTYYSRRKYLFILILSIFEENAFKGNPYYKDIQLTYKEYIQAMKEKLKISV
ncbi:putative phage abortive infection protein [Exercitatus varius]|uniref:putative phage abortive infection protein n=1 Tax=Exercitatus varius TaxID=67857 RepID=UPI00294AFF7C|nr:putative phage abortive infection protein [Exercitatus varius]MDG2942657.1 putative phage abortive infection protein [Exercitatus varius]